MYVFGNCKTVDNIDKIINDITNQPMSLSKSNDLAETLDCALKEPWQLARRIINGAINKQCVLGWIPGGIQKGAEMDQRQQGCTMLLFSNITSDNLCS